MDNLALRWPNVGAGGHYESTYLVASHPHEALTVWIRYTIHQRPHRSATGSIWFTLFEDGQPIAGKVTTTQVRAHPISGAELLTIGTDGTIRRDGAQGSVAGDGWDASWALDFEPVDHDLEHLPYPWMYRTSFPRTKSTSPYPAMRVNGAITVAGRVIAVDGWRGMLGHNWGAQHAHRWIWLRGAGFDQSPEAWLDVVLGRIKIGPFITPWIANGAFAPLGPDGPRRRIGGIFRHSVVGERADGCDLQLKGDAVSLTVSVTAPLSACVGWEYADPSGSTHQVRNCSQAELSMQVVDREGSRAMHTRHGGVYELGSAAFDPAVVMQPYSDG